MFFFLDTANLEEINIYNDFIDGVTTNPSILSKYDKSEHTIILKDICTMVSGHVSVEVISEKCDEMMSEANALANIADNICIKLPCNIEGLRACKKLSAAGIATNMTLCFSAVQALLAAKCGATYVSPFIGRLDDIGADGLHLIQDIAECYALHDIQTKILAASVRSVEHVVRSAIAGANVATLPAKIFDLCFKHPLTDIGLKIFDKDWTKNIQSTL